MYCLCNKKPARRGAVAATSLPVPTRWLRICNTFVPRSHAQLTDAHLQ